MGVESRYLDRDTFNKGNPYFKNFPMGTNFSCDYHPVHLSLTSYPLVDANSPDGSQPKALLPKELFKSLPPERRNGQPLSEKRAREINARILTVLNRPLEPGENLLSPFRKNDNFDTAIGVAQASVEMVAALEGSQDPQLNADAIVNAVRQLVNPEQA